MDGSASLRVEDDQGTRPNSPVSVEGGQASHAPPMSEPEQVAGGTMGILQQLAQALQRAGQPAAITLKRSTIERMARYRPVDFMGKKEDEPSMVENWLERTERMLVQMHCTTEEKLECATSLLQDEAYQWWVSVTRTAPSERVTWEFFLDEFKKHYVGRIYLKNMRREFHNLKQRQMSVTEYQREFTRLSKYAPEVLVSEEEKCRRFEDDLNDHIRAHVTAFCHEDFSKIVTCALNVEKVKKEERERKDKRQGKKNPGQSSSQQQQRKKFRGPQGSNQPIAQATGRNTTLPAPSVASTPGGASGGQTAPHCSYCGRNYIGECWRLTGACLICGSKEHRARDCSRARSFTAPQTGGTTLVAQKGNKSVASPSVPRQGTQTQGSQPGAEEQSWEQTFRSLQQELGRVKEVVKGCAPDTMDTLVQQTESPFTAEVLRYPLPTKFRMPQVEIFDESKIPLTTSILTKIKWSCMGIKTLYDAGLSPPH